MASKPLSEGLQPLKTASNYKFSATKISALGATEYTLALLVQDVSLSVAPYATKLEECVKTVLNSCKKSPRAENLMFRFATFNQNLNEVHGFKLLNSCDEADYDGSINCSGSTALFDAIREAIEVAQSYGKQLRGSEIQVNGIIFVITDGQNNCGRIMDAEELKKLLEAARKEEYLETLTVVLVGVTTDDNITLDVDLKEIVDKVGLTQYEAMGKMTAQNLAKLAGFVSRSISSTSSALGTKKPSKLIPLQKSKPLSPPDSKAFSF
jgi:hypothetical protein